MKKLMYSLGDQMVYLVWELKNDRPALAAICTTDEDLKRYVSDDRKTFYGTETPVFVEKVATNHRYGAHDMSIAANLMRRAS